MGGRGGCGGGTKRKVVRKDRGRRRDVVDGGVKRGEWRGEGEGITRDGEN